jgi:hypothetical protein
MVAGQRGLAMKTNYDVVYWWRGGAEVGEWCEALPGADIDATVQEIERGGRVAVKGRRSIGPPEGAPEEMPRLVPFVDVCQETAYGTTVRLPFQVRVF